MRRLAVTVSTVIALFGGVSCSSEGGAPGGLGNDGLAGLLAGYGPDVSEFQISVAERIDAGGEVTWADYERATNDSAACIEEQGYTVSGPTVGHLMGEDLLVYSVEAPDYLVDPVTGAAPVVEAAMEECSRKYSDYVLQLWGTRSGGVSVEWQDAIFEEYRVRIVECLRDQGIDVDEDAARSVIEEAMRDLLETEPDLGGPDCARISGINDEYRLTY